MSDVSVYPYPDRSKRCTACKMYLPVTAFYPAPKYYLGCMSQCKECMSKRNKAYRIKNAAKLKEKYNDEAAREKRREAQRKQYWKDPEAARAKNREKHRKQYWKDPEAARAKNRKKKDSRQRGSVGSCDDPFRVLQLQAMSKVKNACRTGVLIRPDRCSKCGSIGPVQGHHEDYYKPLDVIWLCAQCHVDRHRLDPELNDLRAKHGFPPKGVDPLS